VRPDRHGPVTAQKPAPRVSPSLDEPRKNHAKNLNGRARLGSSASLPAQAQSSVTIFSVVDLLLRNVKSNEFQQPLGASGLSSSRTGFRGTEDLGGGLKPCLA